MRCPGIALFNGIGSHGGIIPDCERYGRLPTAGRQSTVSFAE
jgi:hypothetical protein